MGSGGDVMIVTFYSYKGGVGRSMAMANIGARLSKQGRRILLVDWDLEAPGIESFFYDNQNKLQEIRSKPGLVDLIDSYRDLWKFSSTQSEANKTLKDRVKELTDQIGSINHLFLPLLGTSIDSIEKRERGLWLLQAGCRDGASESYYVQRVNSLDWNQMYDEFGGFEFLEWLRHELRKNMDIVLIDSRTGFTEMGGVCTQHLADVVVALVAPNDTNLIGIEKVKQTLLGERVKELRGVGRPLMVLPIPTRVDDTSENERAEKFKKKFKEKFGEWDIDVVIPYIARYSFVEELVNIEGRDPSERLDKAYATIANKIEQLYMERLSISEREDQTKSRAGNKEESEGDTERNAKQMVEQLISLAQTKVNEGEFSTATTLLDTALELSQKGLGKKHPITLTCLKSLAAVRTAKGTLDELFRAQELLQRVLDIEENKLGEMHPDTLRTMTDLGKIKQRLKDFAGAQELQLRALELYKAMCGDRNLNTVRTLADLAETLRDQATLMVQPSPEDSLGVVARRLYTQAAEYQRQALEAYKEILGDKHPDTIRMMASSAVTKRLLGALPDALNLLEEALKLHEEVLGAKHPDTLRTMLELAESLRGINSTRATELLEKAHKAYLDELGPDHPDTNRAARALSPSLLQEQAQFSRLYYLPSLPSQYYSRPNEAREIANLLRSDAHTTVDGKLVIARKIILWGESGVGKSDLASYVARERDLQETFSDGVIWITLGESPLLTSLQSKIAKALDADKAIFTSLKEGRKALEELFMDKRCLLILDDLYAPEHIEPFDALHPGCKMLITTSNPILAAALEGVQYDLEKLSDKQAISLLEQYTGKLSESKRLEAHDIIDACGHLPLSLYIVGALLRDDPAWWDKLVPNLRELPGKSSVSKVAQISIKSLQPRIQQLFSYCAVFPKGQAIPRAVLDLLWNTTHPDQAESKDIIETLVQRYLASRNEEGELIIHPTIQDCLRDKYPELPSLHSRLLQAYRSSIPNGLWASGSNDGYFFQHLAYHLLKAGQTDELRSLLLSYDWIRAKLKASELMSLIEDYGLLPVDVDLRLIQETLRLSAKALILGENHFPGQLMGRLQGVDGKDVNTLVEQISRDKRNGIWLRPLTETLTQPTVPLLMTIKTGHGGGGVRDIAVTSDDRLVITASPDKTIKKWDLQTGECLNTIPTDPEQGHRSGIRAIAVTADNRYVISASDDQLLGFWKLDDGTRLGLMREHTSGVRGVAVSPVGALLVSASEDHTLRVWDWKERKMLRVLEGHTGTVYSVAVVPPKGRLAISASADNLLIVWNLETREQIHRLYGHTNRVLAVAVTPDGQTAISGSSDCTLKVWDLTNGSQRFSLNGHTDEVRAVQFIPNLNLAVSGGGDRMLRFWDIQKEKLKCVIPAHNGSVEGIALTTDGRLLFSACSDGTFKAWHVKSCLDTKDWQVQKIEQPSRSAVELLRVNTERHRLAVIFRDGKTASWDTKTFQQKDISANEFADNPMTMEESADGRFLVCLAKTKEVEVCEKGTEITIASFKGDVDMSACSFLPDSLDIVAGDVAGNVHFLRLEGV